MLCPTKWPCPPKVFPLALMDGAKAWYLTLDENDKKDWEKIQKKFKERYDPPDILNFAQVGDVFATKQGEYHIFFGRIPKIFVFHLVIMTYMNSDLTLKLFHHHIDAVFIGLSKNSHVACMKYQVQLNTTALCFLLIGELLAMKMGVFCIQKVNQEKAREQSVILHDSVWPVWFHHQTKSLCLHVALCVDFVLWCRHVWVARFLHAQGTWEVAPGVGRPWVAASPQATCFWLCSVCARCNVWTKQWLCYIQIYG